MEEIETWWNGICHLPIWSGALVEMEWEELWPEAQEDVVEIYNSIS